MATSLVPDSLTARVRPLLERYWGFSQLRPLQADAIAARLDQRDSLVLLPTGSGKSLCYQVPPLLTNRLDIVVSPLIALMKDQVDGLREIGYPAAALHSNQSADERAAAESAIAAGEVRLLFISPERLFHNSFLEKLDRLGVQAFAVDEAHCISHWGHDFRPEYRRLALLRERYRGCSVHAFTATATPRVRDDIIEQLRLRDPRILVGSVDRPNLSYRILQRHGADSQVLEVLRRHANEAAIVYTISRNETERLAEWLQGNGFRAAHYHARMEPADRRRVQEQFSAEELDVVVATVAFGMGIDRSNVRCILHAAMPKSLEHYQQETGRAGRDDLPAECVLLYSGADAPKWENLMGKSAAERIASEPDSEPIVSAGLAAARELLNHIRRYCTAPVCRHRFLVEYFGQSFNTLNCGACDVCLGEVETLPDSTIVAQKILSCVARVQERFGAGHVASVLHGDDTEAIRRHNHQALSTHGLLREFPGKAIANLVMQLVDQGLLDRTPGDLPILKLNALSWEVMRKQRPVALIPPRTRRAKRSHAEKDIAKTGDHDLFERLRRLRKRLAHQRAVPPYIVFSDATLRAIASDLPRNRDALRGIHGIGERKLLEYGDIVIAEVLEFCKENGLHAQRGSAR